MSERTLRDQIAALKVGPYQSRIQHVATWNLAITEVLALIDAHTAAQPAPDAAALDALIAERVREAVEAEREACAQVAADLLFADGSTIAAAIRARASKEGR